MLFAHGEHVRVQINVTAPCARNRERESNHDFTLEGAHHLAADFVGNDKHAQGDQFRVGKVPDFFLKGDAGVEVLDAVAAAKHDGIGGRARFSSAFACCQSDSSSSMEA